MVESVTVFLLLKPFCNFFETEMKFPADPIVIRRQRIVQRILRRTFGLLLVLALFAGWILPVGAATLPLTMPLTVPENQIDSQKPVMRSTVAVHYSPYPGSMVIGQFENHTPITVLGYSGEYCRVDCYELEGYIHRDFVEETETGHRVKHRYNTPDSLFLTDRSTGEGLLLRGDLYVTATSMQGVPYVLGGTTPRGFDCSGFTQYVYRQSGITIPRTCEGQIGAGLIVSKDELICGDLILFTRTNHPTALVTHVGMYLGDGKLIHAGSAGITIVDLDSRYFTEHYLCARRVVPTRKVELKPPVGAAATEGAVITPYTRTRSKSN